MLKFYTTRIFKKMPIGLDQATFHWKSLETCLALLGSPCWIPSVHYNPPDVEAREGMLLAQLLCTSAKEPGSNTEFERLNWEITSLRRAWDENVRSFSRRETRPISMQKWKAYRMVSALLKLNGVSFTDTKAWAAQYTVGSPVRENWLFHTVIIISILMN